jgi:tRNA-2-methylthio-N6-dimethylallyladenosine synthase
VKNQKIYIETYGCQMNFSDSEVVASILKEEGYELTDSVKSADLILVNTCSIRDHAEQRVRNRLHYFGSLKRKKPGLRIGLLGCMADRISQNFPEEEQLLSIVAGPDSYRSLPGLLQDSETGMKAVNTILSEDETYTGIMPVRLGPDGVTAFISVMRGCNNFCAYCVVPYARGRERSRDKHSILEEAGDLLDKGYREVTLLGQNVNSYRWRGTNGVTDFARLMEEVASIHPLLRVRFATSHPKDLSDELLQCIARYPNICKSVHLPLQSGSTRVLERMNRGYTREQYMKLAEAIRNTVPGCTLTTDIIAGFCGETEEDHSATLSMMEEARFDHAFMFAYSERPGTPAEKKLKDDVPADVKNRRLSEIIRLQQRLSAESNRNDLNRVFQVLAEGKSKRSETDMMGRNSQNKVVVFPKKNIIPGEYVQVRITGFTSATLTGCIAENDPVI